MFEKLFFSFGNAPIKHKLLFISMLTSGIAVLLVCIIFTLYNISSFKYNMSKEFNLVSKIVSSNISPYIQFSQKKPAMETLDVFQLKKPVLLACAYDESGEVFVTYDPFKDLYKCPEKPDKGFKFSWQYFNITNDITDKDGEYVGTLYILTDLSEIKHDVKLYITGLVALLLIILSFAYILSSKLQELISGPILNLSEIAQQITKKRLYHIRAEKQYDDETGIMVDSFNNMLAEVEKRDKKLFKSNINLKSLNHTVTTMVNSLGQGFLTFDKNGVCGKVYSKACELLLESSPSGNLITDILKLSANDTNNFKEWISMVFTNGSAISFEDMIMFAPKNFKHSKGLYIDLQYKPVYDDEKGDLESVVLIATDQTDKVEAERIAEEQHNLATTIIKIAKNRKTFISLIKKLRETINIISSKNNITDYTELKREIHTLKGIAGTFHIKQIVQALHLFENELSEINLLKEEQIKKMLNKNYNLINESIELSVKTAKEFLGDEFENHMDIRQIDLSALISFEKHLENSKQYELLEKFRHDIIAFPIFSMFKSYSDELADLAIQCNKEISPLIISGDNVQILPDIYDNFFRTLTHVFRNVADHGIESPSLRKSLNKDIKGRVEVNISLIREKEPKLLIKISDDGGGIDPERIKNKLSTLGIGRNWEKESDEEVIQHVFDSGFSTNQSISEISGRGIGMDAVKEEAIELGGDVYIKSKINVGTTLYITLPYKI